jgi:excisionase family DNA binding protein
MDEWMSESEAARWLGVPIEVVRQSISRGLLPALQLGDHVRVSRTAAIQASGGLTERPPVPAPVQSAASDAQRLDNLPMPAGLTWVDELATADPFVHQWPRRKDTPPSSGGESYPVAWAGTLTLQGERISVLVGQSVPRDDGRPRLGVFFNRYPEAEFAQTTDLNGWASAVKVNGKSTLRMGAPVPALYRRSRLLSYQEAIGFAGPGRTKGLAVVIAADDMRSAVHHAAARWLGKRGHDLSQAV